MSPCHGAMTATHATTQVGTMMADMTGAVVWAEEHLDLADVAGEPGEHVAAAHSLVSGGGHNGGGLGVNVAENPHPNEFEGLERNKVSE